MKIESYKDLTVWRKSIILLKEIYTLTSEFPRSGVYGITNQIRRSAVSIPSNIAEGSGRSAKKDYIRFYTMAFSSGLELETQLIIAKDVELTSKKSFETS